MARVGRLFVDLLARTASFESGLDKSRRKSRKFSKGVKADLKKIGIGFAALGAAAGVGLAVLVKKSIDSADSIAKMGRELGISTEALSVFKREAELGGTDIETFRTGLQRLARNLSDAQNGLVTSKRAFADLGIEVLDSNGNLRNLEEVSLDVADRMSKMQDGTRKTARIMELMGRGGGALINTLNTLGKKGFAVARREAEELGEIIDTKTAIAAEKFNDNLRDLGAVAKGFGLTLASELSPQLVRVTDNLVKFAKKDENLKKFAGIIGQTFDDLIVAGETVSAALGVAAAGLQKIGDLSPVDVTIRFFFGPSRKELQDQVQLFKDDLSERLSFDQESAELSERLAAFLNETFVRVGATLKKVGKDAGEGGSQIGEALQKIIDRIKQQNLQLALGELGWLKYQAAQAGAGPAALATIEQQFQVGEALRLVQAGMQEQAETVTVDLGPAVLELDEKTASLAEQNRRLLGTFEDLDGAGIDLSRTLGEGAEGLGKLKDAGKLVESGFERMFDDAITGGKNLTKILQGIIKQLAGMIIKLVVIKALGFFGVPGFSKGGPVEGRQEGGRALVGEPLLVGEAGPELFIPDVAGEILPNEVFRGAQTALRVPEGFDPADGSRQPQIVNNFNIEGLISADRLEELVQKISNMVHYNDIPLMSSHLK